MQRDLDCRMGLQDQNQLPELQGCCAPAGVAKPRVCWCSIYWRICSVCHPEGKGQSHWEVLASPQWAAEQGFLVPATTLYPSTGALDPQNTTASTSQV